MQGWLLAIVVFAGSFRLSRHESVGEAMVESIEDTVLRKAGARNIYEFNNGVIDVDNTLKRLKAQPNGKRVKKNKVRNFLERQQKKLAALKPSVPIEPANDDRLWALLQPFKRTQYDHLTHRALGQVILQTLAPHTQTTLCPWYKVSSPLKVRGMLVVFIDGMDATEWSNVEGTDVHKNSVVVQQDGPMVWEDWDDTHTTSPWVGANVLANVGEKKPRRVSNMYYDGMMTRCIKNKARPASVSATLPDFALTVDEMVFHDYPPVSEESYNSAMANVKAAPTKEDGSTTIPLLAMDCEMVETEYGSALARVAVVDGATRATVLDMLAMPESPVTDYLTPYSGISESTLVGVTNTLADAQAAVRKLIADTAAAHDQTMPILVGHSLENDLGALQLAYPLILDSAVIYAAAGCIYKKKLSVLTKQLLHREIQADADGHDPGEDALAALDLCLLAVEKGDMTFRHPTHVFEPLPAFLWDSATVLRAESAVIASHPVYLDESVIGPATATQTSNDDETVKAASEVMATAGESTVAGVHKLLCVACLHTPEGVGARVQTLIDSAPADFVLAVLAVPRAERGQLDLSRPGRLVVATKQR
ncbi:Exonuclease [Carpediemonas membranifera]|uniref:Exonuclease n=1 Tax=Carpediemonas membranifera TaxID=201153 RepID=A0A8J6E068_9EUKA|nr:Exonuclease [Carpediemonas membranifera]|eukprot:KAG9391748.1 Exonuclease [Carpediemonas membranifera]